MGKTFRIQLAEKEVWILRNQLAEAYYHDRRNLRWAKKRVALGQPDSQIYTIEHQEKNLKFMKHLLKKLSRCVNVKWFER